MGGWQERMDVFGWLGTAYQQSALKTRVEANATELRRRARGSFAKRVLDPSLFAAPPHTDLTLRTELLRHAGLLDQLKVRNDHHTQRDMVKRRAEAHGYPSSLQIAVTTECNIRCRMCALTGHGKGYKGRHADDHLFKRIEPILPFVSGIKLQGTGEPFLYPGMKQACELGMKYGVLLTTVTNATMIDDDIARMAGPAFREIFVSIDAATADTYKHIRSGGRLEQVLRGLDLINKYRGPDLRLGLAFVIMRDNVHELPEFVRLAKRVNAQLVRASWLVPFDHMPWTLEQEPLAHPELMARWFAETRAVADELSMRVELPPLIVPEPTANVAPPSAAAQARAAAPVPTPATDPAPAPKRPATSVIANLHGRRVKGTCSLMYRNAYIHQDSSVAPCCHLKGRVGNLEKTDFRSIWNGPEMSELRKTFNDGTLPSACTGCQFLRMGRIGDGALDEG